MRKILLLAYGLMISSLCFGQWLIDEDFEGITALPAGWTIHDDGDGMTWRNLNNASHAHSGTRAAFCDNYLPNQNADWLITPQLAITAGDSLIFFTRSWISTEPLKVYVSTTGTAISDFTTQLIHLQNIGIAYQRVAASLNPWAGQSIHLGFLWNCENYGILVDDVRVGHPQMIQPELALPDNFTFLQGESLNVDFTPFVTCTDIDFASLAVSGNANVQVGIDGLQVTFSSPAFNGTETLAFTLTDGLTGLTGTDTVEVVVAPIPVFDLALTSIPSPRESEYQGHPFIPAVVVRNNGADAYSAVVGISCEITDSLGAEVYGYAEFEYVGIPADGEQALSFANAFNPVDLGHYTARFQLLAADDYALNDTLSKAFEVVYRVTQGGPDAFGYRYIDSNDAAGPEFSWTDISATGTSTVMYNVPTWGGDDNFSEPIPLGFAFPWYGQLYSEMYVDINGEILLEDNNWYTAYPGQNWDNDGNMFNYVHPIPGYAQMPGLVAVYWDDLFADQGVGDIYFQTFGEAPNGHTVVQWNNLRFLAGSGGFPVLKFQAIFYENGELLFQYLTTQTGQSGSNVPHQNGRSATVGIQSGDATLGLCYLREIVVNNQYLGVEPPGNLLHDGLAIRFYTGEDTQAPVISHSEPGNTFNQSPELTAAIVDLSPLSSKLLHYEFGGQWQTLAPTAANGNEYGYQLPQLPLGSTLNYYFSATDSQGNTSLLPPSAPDGAFSFQILPTAGASVLLACSGDQDYQQVESTVYQGLLASLEVGYDTYNWEEFNSYRFPQDYDIILCYASVGAQPGEGDSLAVALMQWLESGTTDSPKNLFFASDGFAANSHALPNSDPRKKLMNAYFRSYYVASGLGGGTNGLGGPENYDYEEGSILCYTNSPIGSVGEEYLVYANSPDCIFRYDACPDWYADEVQYPEIGAQSVFLFEDGPIDGQAYLYHGVCATAVTLPIYKTFLFSFDYSQLTGQTQRLELMGDLLDWFGYSGLPASDPQVPVLQTRITGNYPNPFNPQTTIAFTLAEQAPVRLEVFNLRGQKVRTLASGTLASGRHSAVWDGTDDSGNAVSSALYFVRLSAGHSSCASKIMLMK